MPLLFPIALPGMASAVDTLCVLVAFGLSRGQSVPLPKWLANRVLSARVKAMLTSVIHRALAILAHGAAPHAVPSTKHVRALNALMLGIAGLTIFVPVPLISFDNVLPALAIVLIA